VDNDRTETQITLLVTLEAKEVPRELSVREMEDLIENRVDAAESARELVSVLSR
jgi:hypothetical protein